MRAERVWRSWWSPPSTAAPPSDPLPPPRTRPVQGRAAGRKKAAQPLDRGCAACYAPSWLRTGRRLLGPARPRVVVFLLFGDRPKHGRTVPPPGLHRLAATGADALRRSRAPSLSLTDLPVTDLPARRRHQLLRRDREHRRQLADRPEARLPLPNLQLRNRRGVHAGLRGQLLLSQELGLARRPQSGEPGGGRSAVPGAALCTHSSRSRARCSATTSGAGRPTIRPERGKGEGKRAEIQEEAKLRQRRPARAPPSDVRASAPQRGNRSRC